MNHGERTPMLTERETPSTQISDTTTLLPLDEYNLQLQHHTHPADWMTFPNGRYNLVGTRRSGQMQSNIHFSEQLFWTRVRLGYFFLEGVVLESDCRSSRVSQ